MAEREAPIRCRDFALARKRVVERVPARGGDSTRELRRERAARGPTRAAWGSRVASRMRGRHKPMVLAT